MKGKIIFPSETRRNQKSCFQKKPKDDGLDVILNIHKGVVSIG